MKNVLAEIIEHKKIEVQRREQQTPLNQFKNKLQLSTRSLVESLSANQSDFIFECKKASPSAGTLRSNFDLKAILNQYADFASAISILTDHRYFQGQLDYLTMASQQVSQPILCKDFFISPYQVYEARNYGADAILIMLSVVDDNQYQQLATIAESLQLDVLTEVHNKIELQRAIHLDAKIIGINNRNLIDLSIDLATTEKLAPLIPEDRLVIAESGLYNHQQVSRLAPLVDGFLIGSSLMKHRNIRAQCKSLIFGQTKICGLTNVVDARSADQCGATFGGLIFSPLSKRAITLVQAQSICRQVNLNYVGVFVDQPVEEVVNIAKQLSLFAVQLHGNESTAYIKQLKKLLTHTQVWKSVAIKSHLPAVEHIQCDRVLLDSYSEKASGGTGKSFNWQLLKTADMSQLIVAGGVTPKNIQQLKKLSPLIIDICSGTERSPGQKCESKTKQLFNLIRA